MTTELVEWLRSVCAKYLVEPIAVFRRNGSHSWPLVATDDNDLVAQLEAGGHFLPLPTEPAALANVIEVSLAEFIVRKISGIEGAVIQQGTERGYPDLEISGELFGGGYHAVDIKVARRRRNNKQTQSRITLYTGNTYFMYPQIRWPGTFRPFQEYESHLDVLVIYTLNRKSISRIEDLEVIIQEPWRIASKQRSSTTREYLGAVTSIERLRNGDGEFKSAAEFYEFWRKHPFKIGRAAKQQLDKLLKAEGSSKGAGSGDAPPRAKKKK